MFAQKRLHKNWIKKAIAATLTAVLLLGPVPMNRVYAASQTAVVNSNVILREEASSSSKALSTIKEGKSVEVLSVNGSWVQVKTGSLTGFVYGKYLGEISKTEETAAVSNSSSLKKGDEGQAVKEMQRALIALGFLGGEATGSFGAATKQAVQNFQSAEGLTADGVAGKQTLARINERLAAKKGSSDKQTTDTASGSLKKGDEGQDVKDLQSALITLGFLGGDATGSFGEATKQAVQNFQTAEGLTADGVAGKKTLAKISERLAEKKAKSDSQSDTASGSLKKGSEGADVTKLQQLLKAAGYFSGETTGFFGSLTEKAVKAFQTAKGLTADGVAGKKTIAALSEGAASAADNKPAQSSQNSVLREGDEGEAVKTLQELLIQKGYLKSEPTGFFGSATYKALMQFQKENNLTADGVAGPETILKLVGTKDKTEDKSETTNNTSLKKGDENDAVKAMQQALIEKGYLKTEATGFFGSATESALKKFQKDNKLTADGVAGQETLQKLLGTQANTDKKTETANSNSASLKKGDEGDAVKAMQQALIEKGYLKTEATGFFGSSTESALKKYQKENNLTADGVAGQETLQKLLGTQEKTDKTPETLSSNGSLKKGDEGDAVKAMQQVLIEKGYLKTEATGFFGSATESAVMKFQADNKLTADGVVGAATLKALNATLVSSNSETPVQPATEANGLKKGDENDDVKAMQQLLIQAGYLSTDATGFFGDATEAAVLKFQADNKLTADGVVGDKTLKALKEKASGSGSANLGSANSETTSNPTPEPTKTHHGVVLEDWWTGYIDSTFKRGETALVTDVKTGISFTIARYGGSNHLDAEPLTPADSEKYFQCFNYVHTWTARPIHITINGVTYAAAMNGMPHGGERITSNNFNGQFCIHFLNSRTHGGNQVNQDMQKQIMVAYNTTA